MRITRKINIPDLSRPGLTTTTTGAGAQQDADGKYATVRKKKVRRRGGREFQRRRERREGRRMHLKIRSLNIGTMTGKGRELPDIMERGKLNILCIQET